MIVYVMTCKRQKVLDDFLGAGWAEPDLEGRTDET